VGIERCTGDDLMQLAADVGPVPWQVGALLRMRRGGGLEHSVVAALIGDRIVPVSRLRQVLVRPPLGCGRRIWVDDPDFHLSHHVRSVACPPPGDERALLDTAVAIVTERLSMQRPLWRATLVTGLADGEAALVVVFHHVLADGIGGLAVLAQLVDGAAPAEAAPFPRPAPTSRQLAQDVISSRLRALRRSWRLADTLRRAVAELDTITVKAPTTSLNMPTGSHRKVAVARADLGKVRRLARDHSATVNDVILTAATGALGHLLDARGEDIDRLIVSVPVSARASATATSLGNRVGVMALSLPVRGAAAERLEHVAAMTRAHRTEARGSSAAVLGPLFRIAAALGVFRWLTNRQRMINVVETNLRGPETPMTFGGNVITEVLPVTSLTGNVTVSFAVMSYAGSIAVVVVADPERNRDVETLGALLQRELDTLTDAPVEGHATKAVKLPVESPASS
jgi:diacylglycerol O-acyltransferase / wax synthase